MLKTDIVLSGFYYFVLFRGVIGEDICFRPVLLSCGVMVEEVCFRPVLLSRGVMGEVFCFRPVLFRGVMVEAFCFRPVLLSRGIMGRHFVFGLSSCPKSLYPQLVLQIQYKYKYFLFPIKEPFQAEQLTKNLIQWLWIDYIDWKMTKFYETNKSKFNHTIDSVMIFIHIEHICSFFFAFF